MRMLPIALLLLTLGVGGRGLAQAVVEPSTYIGDPGAAQVLRWLHGSDARLQAWAARDIREYGMTELVPELTAQLARMVQAGSGEERSADKFRAVCAMLDTLIQMEAVVPVETLARVEQRGWHLETEELVLLSRMAPEDAAGTISGYYKPGSAGDTAATRVAAQLLALHPPKGFGAEVLRSVRVRVRITVHDPNSLGGFSSGGGTACGGGMVAARMDWPEIGRYSFEDPPTRGEPMQPNETVFLSGVDAVHLLRTVGRTYYPSAGRRLSPLDDAKRSHLVGTMLHGNPMSPFPEDTVALDIWFQSREAYEAQVRHAVEEQQSNFAQVASALTALDIVTEKERQAGELRVELLLADVRKKPAEDLPVVAFREPVIWVNTF